MFPFNLTGLLGGVILSLLIGSVSAGLIVHNIEQAAYVTQQRDDARAQTAAVTAAKDELARKDAIAYSHGVTEARAQQKLDDQRSLIPTEVIRHVKDTVVCVPFGVIRVFNGYARGLGTADESIASGQPDDACTTLPWRSIADDIADDYAIGVKNAEQLNQLEAAIVDIHNSPPAH